MSRKKNIVLLVLLCLGAVFLLCACGNEMKGTYYLNVNKTMGEEWAGYDPETGVEYSGDFVIGGTNKEDLSVLTIYMMEVNSDTSASPSATAGYASTVKGYIFGEEKNSDYIRYKFQVVEDEDGMTGDSYQICYLYYYPKSDEIDIKIFTDGLWFAKNINKENGGKKGTETAVKEDIENDMQENTLENGLYPEISELVKSTLEKTTRNIGYDSSCTVVGNCFVDSIFTELEFASQTQKETAANSFLETFQDESVIEAMTSLVGHIEEKAGVDDVTIELRFLDALGEEFVGVIYDDKSIVDVVND